MDRAHLLWLSALVLALAGLALEPLATFAVFGSDTGEYARLTQDLSTSGHLPLSSYNGWGFAYQDFPGIFVVSAAAAGATGAGTLLALQLVVPLLAILSVVPLFLLFRRLHPSETVALLGAGLSTVAMPRLFSLAHPAPLALGDLFVVAALWMFVEGRRDPRWYVPLSITALALIVTHHLSSYFFVVSALGGLFLFELYRPGRWSHRFPARELVFLAAFLLALVAYWFAYATAFHEIVLQGLGGLSALGVLALGAGALALVAGAGLAIRVRRARYRPSARTAVRLPTDRAVLRDLLLIGAGVALGSALLVLVSLPGSEQTTSPLTVVWFLPLIASIALAAGARRLLFFTRPGPLALTWLGAVAFSAAFALATSSPVLLPSRHAEYLLLPLGLLMAIGVGRLLARASEGRGRPAAAAVGAAAVVLLAANAAIVYPPPALFGGFQEGLTPSDAAAWMWVGVGVPVGATVASDHRLSSMIFGFDGNNATWDSTPQLFVGSSWAAAAAELSASYAPHGAKVPVDVVVVDSVMHDGVALDPSQLALPMSPQAIAWLAGPPFVLLYENGGESVYWVDFSAMPPGAAPGA